MRTAARSSPMRQTHLGPPRPRARRPAAHYPLSCSILQHAYLVSSLQRGNAKESTGPSSDQGARACAQAGSQEGCSSASCKGPCFGPQGPQAGCQGCRSGAGACRQACRTSCQGAGSMQPCQMLELRVSFSLQRADRQALLCICSTQALATGGPWQEMPLALCRLQGQAKRRLCRLLTS